MSVRYVLAPTEFREAFIDMSFKSEYLADAGVTPQTYATTATAITQICEIYRARRGKIKRQFGERLWNDFVSPLASQFPALPSTRHLYDTFATEHMLRLTDLLRQNRSRDDFGVAQKMFNLFLKDHWALNVFSPQSELLLHLPLDCRILKHLRYQNLPSPWNGPWTKVAVNPQTQATVLAGYLQIQNSFRAYQEQEYIAARFASPIEMDQMLWHQI
jgi:hypothetical protein